MVSSTGTGMADLSGTYLCRAVVKAADEGPCSGCSTLLAAVGKLLPWNLLRRKLKPLFSERFWSLGLTGAPSSSDQLEPRRGRINWDSASPTAGVAAGGAFACDWLSFSRYRSDPNSVMCKGSMFSGCTTRRARLVSPCFTAAASSREPRLWYRQYSSVATQS